jgi:hypothetical protein
VDFKNEMQKFNPLAALGREVGSKVPTGGGYFLGSFMGKKKIIQLIPKGQFFFYNAPCVFY